MCSTWRRATEAGQASVHAPPSTMPLDLQNFLSRSARERPLSAIRGLLPMEKRPGMISLLAGKPNPDGFPFESITLQLKPTVELGKGPRGEPVSLKIEGEDMKRVLQYGSTSADPSFDAQLIQLVSHVHRRVRGNGQPDGDFAMTVGSGSQDLLYKTISILFDPGETVLVENPVYPYVVS